MAKRDPAPPEIGDTVILTGEVVHIDSDGTPRVHVSGVEYPVRVSPDRFVQLIKGRKPPKWDKP